jgi:hypothetical protein
MQNNSGSDLKEEIIKGFIGHLMGVGFTVAGIIVVAAFTVYMKMQTIETNLPLITSKNIELTNNINDLRKNVIDLQKEIELLKQAFRFANRDMKGMIKNDTPPHGMKYWQNQDDKPSPPVIYDAEIPSRHIKAGSTTECTGKECEQPPIPAPPPPTPKPPTPTMH